MSVELETEVLKGVSRSFYLSLRFLPAAMRRPASVAYLLARLSDTIADSVSVSSDERLAALGLFLQQVRGSAETSAFPENLSEGVGNLSERRLLRESPKVLAALKSLTSEEQILIREVLETIVSGQVLDLQRFGKEDGNVRVLESAEALDDYTWRVAGCVGLFWTRLGFLTMGDHFSNHPRQELEDWAVDYGKGLQLVNILRDVPEDRRSGRCYLPVDDPENDDQILAEFRRWRKIAAGRISCGRRYAEKLSSKRLRFASVMPAAIAEETIKLLDISKVVELERRIKVTRGRIYLILLRELALG
jgi:farnesyl-diphosphate farnesyltransferase